jgi:hypothetical protein
MKNIAVYSLILLGGLNGDRAFAAEGSQNVGPDSQAPLTNVVRVTPEFIGQLAEEMRTNHPPCSRRARGRMPPLPA